MAKQAAHHYAIERDDIFRTCWRSHPTQSSSSIFNFAEQDAHQHALDRKAALTCWHSNQTNTQQLSHSCFCSQQSKACTSLEERMTLFLSHAGTLFQHKVPIFDFAAGRARRAPARPRPRGPCQHAGAPPYCLKPPTSPKAIAPALCQGKIFFSFFFSFLQASVNLYLLYKALQLKVRDLQQCFLICGASQIVKLGVLLACLDGLGGFLRISKTAPQHTRAEHTHANARRPPSTCTLRFTPLA